MVNIPTKRLFLRPDTQVLVEGEGIQNAEYLDVLELDGPCPDYGPSAAWGTPRSGEGGTVQQTTEMAEAYCATRAIDGKTVIVKKQDIARMESLR